MTSPAPWLPLLLCGLLAPACDHLGSDPDPAPLAPLEAAQTLDRDLLLLVDGATTLKAEVQGVQIETRIALTPEESEATWARAASAFDDLQPHLGLHAQDELALEYRFALLHLALQGEDDGSAAAAELHAELSPHLSRVDRSDLAIR